MPTNLSQKEEKEEKVNLILLLIGLILTPQADWDKAYKHVQSGKQVYASLRGADVEEDEYYIKIFLLDKDKKIYLRSISFGYDKPANFALDLTKTLKDYHPSQSARIYVEGHPIASSKKTAIIKATYKSFVIKFGE